MNPEILVIGNRGGSNIGESFFRACERLGISAAQMEPREAMDAPGWLRRAHWLLDHRPARMNQFAGKVAMYCETHRPRLVLSVGFAPLPRPILARIGEMGICRAVYLTDDPWNPAHRSRWFLNALPDYDYVFSARRANLQDCELAGAKRVSYLPFGYDPTICQAAKMPYTDAEKTFDVLFAGGADRARVPYISALAKAGFNVGLFGSYWERFAETRELTRGQAPATDIAGLVARSRVCLCLVRQANRDDASMRSFELPAMRACVLTEYTDEHARLFGNDGECVVFFRTIDEMVAKTHNLVADVKMRERLAAAVSKRIRNGKHTYSDRLLSILQATNFTLTREACPA